MTAPRSSVNGATGASNPGASSYRPSHHASSPEVEHDDVPIDAQGTAAEPDDRAGEPAFFDQHPAAKLASQALGATAGAIGGAVAGSVLGIAAGPIGSLVGAAAGAAFGGLAGVGAGVIDDDPDPWVAEDRHWREAFAGRPYAQDGAYDGEWAPAYRYGAEAYRRHAPMGTWSEAEARLGMGWPDARGESTLAWDDARHAARDAWERMKQQAGKA